MTAEYRASFDAVVRFTNGGDLSVHRFRVDVPSADVTEDEIGALFVASLGLLMSEPVSLSNVSVFVEPHKGTRGGPSDRTQSLPLATGRLVELSHVIRAGMVTYPGVPGICRGSSRGPSTRQARSSLSTGSTWSVTPGRIWIRRTIGSRMATT
jgi:hypothetical protein